jgi:hypothetical protein
MKLVAFCEAPADFRLASGLVDRVLRASGLPWVIDNLETPEVIRSWQPDGFGQPYFDVHDLNRYADQLGVRTRRGHFNGQPGRPGSAMARKAFLIARALHKQHPGEPLDAVILLWDTDQDPARCDGVATARNEARSWAPFQILCGFPDPEREAWVLAGFEPGDAIEQQRLDELRQALQFSPVHDAARLRDKTRGAPRNIKRVLGILTNENLDREARCWLEPPLETLRARGGDTGLTAFLDELFAAVGHLLPSAAMTPRSS